MELNSDCGKQCNCGANVITVVAIVVIVVVLGVAMRARLRVARTERRSVDGYGRSLGTLGSVSKRTSAGAPVHIPSPDRLAQPHVQSTSGEDAFKPAAGAVPPPRVHLEPPVLPHISSRGLPVFGDELDTGGEDSVRNAVRQRGFWRGDRHRVGRLRSRDETSGSIARNDGVTEQDASEKAAPTEVFEPITPLFAPTHAAAKLSERDDEQGIGATYRPAIQTKVGHGRHGVHGTVTAAAAAIALVVVGVSVWRLEGSSVPSKAAHHVNSRHVPRGHSPSGNSPNTNTPGFLEPVSASKSLVTYGLGSNSYTVSFSATGPCWVGVESAVNGPYLWMTTLNSGGSASYRGTSPLVIRLGAPKVVRLTVNGNVVHLPKSNVNPFDVTFTPEASASAWAPLNISEKSKPPKSMLG